MTRRTFSKSSTTGTSLLRAGEFFVGQRVRLSETGMRVKKSGLRYAIVHRIEDLSYAIPVDREEKRNFSLEVVFDGNKGPSEGGNAVYWEPVE